MQVARGQGLAGRGASEGASSQPVVFQWTSLVRRNALGSQALNGANSVVLSSRRLSKRVYAFQVSHQPQATTSLQHNLLQITYIWLIPFFTF